jgi:hypothetical protein
VIPFKFDKLHLTHCDTIPATLDLEEEVVNINGIDIKMDIANTIPLGVEIMITALDEKNNPINDIHMVEPIKIEACNDDLYANLHDEAITNEVVVRVEGTDFTKLAKLKFELKVDSQEGETVTLRDTHGIQVSNMALIITGDIATETEE